MQKTGLNNIHKQCIHSETINSQLVECTKLAYSKIRIHRLIPPLVWNDYCIKHYNRNKWDSRDRLFLEEAIKAKVL